MKLVEYDTQIKRIKEDEIKKYTENGKDFINDQEIIEKIEKNKNPDPKKVRDILQKSLSLETLTPDETATLLNVNSAELLEEMKETALKVKKKVYDNRIVTFAPLYLSNLCINNCLYCGFRRDNKMVKRKLLSFEEIEEETKVLAGKIGHKRLIVVYGEHPLTGIDYIARSIETIYKVKVEVNQRINQIRRVNVNAPPLSIEELKILKQVGIGTYQVFQETYHHKTYESLHPKGTIKSNYQWRLYCMHRALEAGIDDVGIGALFGLYDWRFEVMGLLYHARELEKKFGIGPHTISFPRLEPAINTPFTQNSKYKVSDQDFEKLIVILRLSVPYTGMILTARESPQIRDKTIPLGITQTDASSKIGIGAYSQDINSQQPERQQFLLGDTRSLDELIRDLAKKGYITSFCTAGYRCGRTGKCIMELLKTGKEAIFCKINAILTFREWLDDFATKETKKIGEELIEKEIKELKEKLPYNTFLKFIEFYERTKRGERDLYF